MEGSINYDLAKTWRKRKEKGWAESVIFNILDLGSGSAVQTQLTFPTTQHSSFPAAKTFHWSFNLKPPDWTDFRNVPPFSSFSGATSSQPPSSDIFVVYLPCARNAPWQLDSHGRKNLSAGNYCRLECANSRTNPKAAKQKKSKKVRWTNWRQELGLLGITNVFTTSR